MQDRALFEFATYLDTNNVNPIKAAAVYEQYLSLQPSSPRAPLINLRLAEIYRKLGAEKRSLNKLYEVLSSSIRSGGKPQGEDYTRQAMLKIGNNHFEAGQYEEAARIYSRLKLLDLPPDEQAFVLFRAVDLLFRTKKYAPAIEAGRQFLTQYPKSEFVPDCRQLIIQSLASSGQQDQAIKETVELLQATQKVRDPGFSTFWRIKTGNDLANVLYSHGEFLRALHMYQTLANLNKDPSWNLQTVYQIGLCFEGLKEPRRAIEAYRYITDAKIPAAEPGKGASSASGIHWDHLKEMAAWRAQHIEWLVDAGTKLYPILAPKLRSTTPPPQAAPPQAVPPQAVPPQAVPPQAVPPQAVPPQAVPPQAVPPQAVPPQAVPPQAVPPQAIPPQAIPPRAIPPRALPAQAVPAQAVPAQAVPAQAVPAQAIPPQ